MALVAMTQDDAREDVLLLRGKHTDITADLVDRWLLEGAKEIAKTGVYRGTVSPSSSTSQRYVDLANAAVYDALWVIYTKYDGKRIKPFASLEALDDWRTRNGTTLTGTPERWAVDNPYAPHQLWFERTPDGAKTVDVLYAKAVAAWTDLPDPFRQYTKDYARGALLESTEREERAKYYLEKFQAFTNRLKKRVRKWQSELDVVDTFSTGWLTTGL